MTSAVIGATGHVGSEVVHGLLAHGEAVSALVRDADEARRVLGEADGLHIRATRLDDRRDVSAAFRGIRTVFIAMGSVGIQGFYSGSRSMLPPESPRSSRSPGYRC